MVTDQEADGVQPVRRKAISYIRMSTEMQLKGHSLQRQKKLTEEYCERNGFELVEELRDIGVSGFSGKHREKGQLGLFFDALRNEKIDPSAILVVENLDRLSRQDPLTAMSQFTEILNYGIEIHTLFDQQVYTKETVGTNMGLLFLSIGQMIRAYDESRTKSQRLAAVWEKKRQDPETYLTSRSPNWIKVIKDESGRIDRYELDEAEANIVRRIFDLTINKNMGSFAIARYLNENLDLYPKKKTDRRNAVEGWGDSYVKKILTSQTVFGQFQPMKIVGGRRVPACDPINGYYPPVISEAEFRLAQDRQKQRTINGRGRKGEGFPNIFTGLVKCAKCHSTLRYRDRGRRPKGTVTLHCSAALQNRGDCDAKTVRYREFEEQFFSVVSDIDFVSVFGDDDFKGEELALEMSISSDASTVRDLKAKLDALFGELTQPGLRSTLKDRIRDNMNRLDTELVEVEQRLVESQGSLEDLRNKTSRELHGELIRDVRDLLDGLGAPEEKSETRRDINYSLKRLIKVIYVDNSPQFHIEDVRAEIIDEDDLSREFLSWFRANRTDRWKYQNPVEFVASEYGFAKHQEFKRMTYIHFKNGQQRGMRHNGEFWVFDKSTGNFVDLID